MDTGFVCEIDSRA